MSILSQLFGPKYDDHKINVRASEAITADAKIKEPGQLSVSSQDGVVTLLGSAFGDVERYSIEGTIRSALKAAGLKYVRLVNEIQNPLTTPFSDSQRSRTMSHYTPKVNFREWWSTARPTKTAVFWSWMASIVLTMIIGFAWGGWVTGGTAQRMGTVMAQDAIVKRLAPICVAQFNLDAAKDQKLAELKAMNSYQRGDYVGKQGWATMPDEKEPDRKVADECAKLLTLLNP